MNEVINNENHLHQVINIMCIKDHTGMRATQLYIMCSLLSATNVHKEVCYCKVQRSPTNFKPIKMAAQRYQDHALNNCWGHQKCIAREEYLVIYLAQLSRLNNYCTKLDDSSSDIFPNCSSSPQHHFTTTSLLSGGCLDTPARRSNIS